MKHIFVIMVLVLVFLVNYGSGWPVEAGGQNRAFTHIMDSVEKLKQSDDEIWNDFMRFRRYTKYDIDTLVYKINELVQEVNRLKTIKNT